MHFLSMNGFQNYFIKIDVVRRDGGIFKFFLLSTMNYYDINSLSMLTFREGTCFALPHK